MLVNLLVFSSTLICRLCIRRSSTVLGEERIYGSLRGTQKAVTMALSKDSAHEGDWRGQLDKPEIKIDSFGRLILSLESGRLLASNQRAISFLFFSKTHPGVLLDQHGGSLWRGDSLFPQNWGYRGAALLLTWRVSRPQMSLTRLKSRYM